VAGEITDGKGALGLITKAVSRPESTAALEYSNNVASMSTISFELHFQNASRLGRMFVCFKICIKTYRFVMLQNWKNQIRLHQGILKRVHSAAGKLLDNTLASESVLLDMVLTEAWPC